MGKSTAQKKSNGTDSGLNFEAQPWAAGEQAMPAFTVRISPICDGYCFNDAC